MGASMKIELCEDNGLLNDGKPTLVVLVIDGKHRIPYEASKTIQELYVDAAKFKDNVPGVLNLNPQNVTVPLNLDAANIQFTPYPPTDIRSKDYVNHTTQGGSSFDNLNIEKEDIVKCIKVHPRDKGADVDLEVGNEYRVIFIKKQNGKVSSYDLMDDNSTVQFIITCLPDEVELLRKRKVKTNPVKTDYKQEIMKCDQCGTMNAINLDGDKYVGECEKCEARLEKERPVAKPVAG